MVELTDVLLVGKMGILWAVEWVGEMDNWWADRKVVKLVDWMALRWVERTGPSLAGLKAAPMAAMWALLLDSPRAVWRDEKKVGSKVES